MTSFAQLLADGRQRAFDASVRGRLLNSIGDVFSVYCVCKVGVTRTLTLIPTRTPTLTPTLTSSPVCCVC